MLQDEDYDSDTSDEDFLPEGAESEDEPGSEDEEEEHDDDEEAKNNVKVKKKKSSKKKKKNPLLADLEETEQKFPTDAEDKGEIPKDGKDKEKADNLWADFLADVEDTATPPPKPKSSSWASLLGNKKTPNSSSIISGKAPATTAKKQEKKEEAATSNSTMVKITQVFDFAGEEVRVEKEVDANSDEAKIALSSPSSGTTQEGMKGMKRPSGLSSIMGLLDGKKQKLTTLEKTKLDWNNFKSNEGIDEDLESHKKSKHGYLDKQAFLERADVRQFEIERAMRMNKRSSR